MSSSGAFVIFILKSLYLLPLDFIMGHHLQHGLRFLLFFPSGNLNGPISFVKKPVFTQIIKALKYFLIPDLASFLLLFFLRISRVNLLLCLPFPFEILKLLL